MFGSKKDAKPSSKNNNPFDSDEEKKDNRKYKPSRKASSEYNLVQGETNTNPFDDGDVHHGRSSSSSYAPSYGNRNMYKNDFRESGGLESQSVEDLENYAVYKAEETTKSVNNMRKIAEEMREEASKTLVMLHHQGEQITRSHDIAAGIDHDLSRGEKLLGSLGGMFSKTWKPKKTGTIKGPTIFSDDPVRRSANHVEQREKLGLNSAPKGQSNPRRATSEPTNAFERVEVEKGKQDDALSDISDMLGELKGMAIDMGTEIDRHIGAINGFEKDTEKLNDRMNGANRRTRHLLGK
ncbi:SNAP25 homologous protein SNAP33-like [Vicia villosa]|uniref:SNAP25 homologous protein SNAP33-like n=1 Tax=Vicia villosa TaxID=3911 RepID=UPI00273B02FD|nr:SNAP25 homologous protein SNAP33-like [Vicia villosa]